MNIKNNTKRIEIKSIEDLNSIDYDKLMYPVIMYGKEKIENNMYDDWDEYKHTRKMIDKLQQTLKHFKIDIYYLEENNLVVGICFLIFGKEYMTDFLQGINERHSVTTEKFAHLTCFHILKQYRGIGTKWIKEVIFPSLIESNIEQIYVKTSHNKALHFYQNLGTQVGQYIGISDNELYQRLGYIFKLDIKR